MKKLIRAFIGDLKKSDMLIEHQPDNIYAYNKKNNVFLGKLRYTYDEIDDYCVIYVEWFGINVKYHQTLVGKYILDTFKRDIIDPAITKYGKENVLIRANIINPSLYDMLARITKKMGLNFDAERPDGAKEKINNQDTRYTYVDNDGYDVNTNNLAVNIQEQLKTLGINVVEYNDYDIIVRNANIDLLLDTLNGHPYIDLNKVYIGVTLGGDLDIGVGVSEVGDNIKWRYTPSNHMVDTNDTDDLFSDLQSYPHGLIDNMDQVFDQNTVFKIYTDDGSMDMDLDDVIYEINTIRDGRYAKQRDSRLRKHALESLFDKHMLGDDAGVVNPEPKAVQERDYVLQEIDPKRMPEEGFSVNRVSEIDEPLY